MPIVNTNFVAGKMNKSVDERLVPPGQYVNAINVRLGSTETTEIGAVENSKGNTQLTTLAYGGQNLSNSALLFLENIFYKEQNIPKELIPLVSDNQKW